jgi:hypothetical protein
MNSKVYYDLLFSDLTSIIHTNNKKNKFLKNI